MKKPTIAATTAAQQRSKMNEGRRKKNKLIICVIYGCVEIDLWTGLYIWPKSFHKTSTAAAVVEVVVAIAVDNTVYRAGAFFFCYSSFIIDDKWLSFQKWALMDRIPYDTLIPFHCNFFIRFLSTDFD